MHQTNKLIDRTGERHGRLLITGKAPGSRKSWYVRCDCGTEKSILYGNLRTTTSCGCWKAENKYQKDVSGVPLGASMRYLVLDGYIRGAQQRGYTWNLSDEEFDTLTARNCEYCGAPPSNVKKSPYEKGDFVYNGIDRVINAIGYEPDNCVSCCKTCNRAKDTMARSEFIAWARRVAQRS